MAFIFLSHLRSFVDKSKVLRIEERDFMKTKEDTFVIMLTCLSLKLNKFVTSKNWGK